MNKLLSFIIVSMIVPATLQGMVRRAPGRPRASQTAIHVPRRTIVDVRHLKHVHTIIKPDCAHVSPLVGASLIHSDYLKKVHQFAPNHPTTRLLNDPKLGLFNLQNTQFRDAQSLSIPGKSLNPELLGEIIGHLQTGQLMEPQMQAALIKKWKKNINDTFKTSISSEKLSQFFQLIQDSKNAETEPAEKRLFMPGITEAALTGFLYRKATTKDELYAYLNSLNKQVPL